MTRFDRDTFAEALGDGAYRVHMDTAWWVIRGPNGGYVAACLVNAMRGEVDPGRALRSLTVHYASAPAEGEARVQVRVERSGRSLSSVSARMTQGDKVLALALAGFGAEYPSGLAYAETMPAVPALEDVPVAGAAERGFTPPRFAGNFAMRPTLGSAPFTGGDEAIVGGWVELGEPRPLDEPLLVTYADAWWPAPFSVVSRPVVAPTIDLTVHVLAELPRSPQPVFVRMWSGNARAGYFEEHADVWGADGTLLAKANQLALLL